jgi:hypothetical protein
MKHRFTGVVPALAVTMLLAGCRQSDGTVPTPAGEQINKTSDISRDLQNVAADRANASDELRDDLEGLTEVPPPPHLAEALSGRLVEALKGSTLNEETAGKLAGQLFVAAGARELSDRQVEMLKQDIAATVTDAGATAERAAAVGEVVGDIQAAVGTNRRRWWHVR